MEKNRIAVIFLALLLAGAKPSGEQHKDILRKAQNLSLQRERVQAAKLIVRSLDREKASKARKELIAALRDFTEFFYTEKGQQQYEQARTILYKDTPGTISRLKEALEAEAQNVAVLYSLSQAYLILGKCEEALETVEKGLEMNPFSEDLIVARAQAGICAQKPVDLKTLVKEIDPKKKEMGLVVDVLSVQKNFFEGKYDEAMNIVEKKLGAGADFPELFYWKNQIEIKTEKDGEKSAQQYLQLCHGDLGKVRRKYYMEPRTCLETARLEAWLKTVRQTEAEK